MVIRYDAEAGIRRVLDEGAAAPADRSFHHDPASVTGPAPGGAQSTVEFLVVGDIDDPGKVGSFAIRSGRIWPQAAHAAAAAVHQCKNDG